MSTLADEAARRRTFAVIAHPDAGKSTLTNALALHAHVISKLAPSTARPATKATVSTDGDGEGPRHLHRPSALQFSTRPRT